MIISAWHLVLSTSLLYRQRHTVVSLSPDKCKRLFRGDSSAAADYTQTKLPCLHARQCLSVCRQNTEHRTQQHKSGPTEPEVSADMYKQMINKTRKGVTLIKQTLWQRDFLTDRRGWPATLQNAAVSASPAEWSSCLNTLCVRALQTAPQVNDLELQTQLRLLKYSSPRG